MLHFTEEHLNYMQLVAACFVQHICLPGYFLVDYSDVYHLAKSGYFETHS